MHTRGVKTKMTKTKKLCYFQIIDGTKIEIEQLSKALNSLKSSLELDLEFLITNERIELKDTKFLIEELYKLYQKTKK